MIENNDFSDRTSEKIIHLPSCPLPRIHKFLYKLTLIAEMVKNIVLKNQKLEFLRKNNMPIEFGVFECLYSPKLIKFQDEYNFCICQIQLNAQPHSLDLICFDISHQEKLKNMKTRYLIPEIKFKYRKWNKKWNTLWSFPHLSGPNMRVYGVLSW